tara:strand:- start:487 stop:2424 length:1938 start_codon:yes stop_codon:yes gene_type:complete
MNKILWSPTKEQIDSSNLESLKQIINLKYDLNLSSYLDIHDWSVKNVDQFWEIVWNDTGIIYSQTFTKVVDDVDKMPGARWFESSKLNFSENLLRKKNNDIAIEFYCEDKLSKKISYKELNHLVSKVSNSFLELGIKPGDRIAAVMPNIPETIVCMLACVAIGAVWSSCSPDFGSDAILNRFKQINPRLLISTDGYYYKGKIFDLSSKLKKIKIGIESIQDLIIIDYTGRKINYNYLKWENICSHKSNEIKFSQESFDHPLYIMYSSGTTGEPKSIVHSAGGTLIQHLKELKYHVDLKEKDKIFYYTTCGWMMWNWLVSSLAFGCTLVLYDGCPFYPNNRYLLKLMDEINLTIFGTSAKYISSLKSNNIHPNKIGHFKYLRSILSTGSPLVKDLFDFVYDCWKTNVQLSSISGGTDIISCFALGNPIMPVRRGELQSFGLGMSVKSFDENGKHVYNNKGELVCDKAFPSMPIYFWNDDEGVKFKKSYFSKFDKIWTHGDFILINDFGGIEIFGRSDATLNPGGVRIGTSEIYQILDSLNYIEDSLLVCQKWDDDERIILFLKLIENTVLSADMIKDIKIHIKTKCSPRHIPSKIIQIKDIPYTINGKKVEIAVRDIIHGLEPQNQSALANPESLSLFKNLAQLSK